MITQAPYPHTTCYKRNPWSSVHLKFCLLYVRMKCIASALFSGAPLLAHRVSLLY
jgi:hypothetical protein